MRLRSRIKGLGMYVPPRVVTNDDLAKRFPTTDEWVRQRTGIEQRRYAEEGIAASDLGKIAAELAIEKAGIGKDEIDCILFASLSPDHHFPGGGCYMQEKLGMRGVAVMDIRNQCTGFLYGLATADSFIRTGLFRNVLVVGAEVHSSALDYSEAGRDVAVLFGDGAGAAVVGLSEEEDRGFLSFDLHADGKFTRALYLDIWDISKKPYIADGDMPRLTRYPQMDGKTVFKHAVTRLGETIHHTLRENEVTMDQVKLLIPHQANLRINEFVARAFDLSEDRVHNNIQKYGNTTAASIPICLHEALELGKAKEGDLIMLAAFGAGFTWGSALMRY